MTNSGMNWGPAFAFDTNIGDNGVENPSGSFRSWLHACVALGLAIIIKGSVFSKISIGGSTYYGVCWK